MPLNPDQPPELLVFTFVADQSTKVRLVMIPVARIVDRTGLDPAAVDDAIGHLGAEGLVSVWTPAGDPVATLTPLGAAHLGLKLRSDPRGPGGFTWQPVGGREQRDRIRARARTVSETCLDVGLDGFASDQLPPDAIAEAREQVALLSPRPARRLPDRDLDPDRLPWPARLVGSTTPWTCRDVGEVCESCLNAPLAPGCFCLRCSRWSFDWLLARIWRAEQSASADRKSASPARKSLAQRRAGA